MNSILSLFYKIIEPASAITNPEQRRQASLLSAILIVFIFVIAWMVAVRASEFLSVPGTSITQLLLSLVVGIIIIGLYIGSRTPYYQICSSIIIGLAFLVIHAAPFLSGGEPYNFLFGLLPILLAGIFLNLQWVAVLSGANVFIMILFFVLGFAPLATHDWYFRLMIIVELSLLIFVYYRNVVEKERRAVLQEAFESTQKLSATVAASEAQLSLILDASPDMIFNIDPQGMIRYFNHDREGQSVVGQSLVERFFPESFELFESAKAKAIEKQQMVEYEAVTADLAYSIRVGEIKSQGENDGFIVTVTNITEQKRAEEQLQREQRQENLIAVQQQLIQELSTPIIPVMEGIIVMPLIGVIDKQRARDLMRTLLTGIAEYEARVVIVDITGVSVIDSEVANYLNRMIQAAQLKGTRTIITGVSDAVAETVVDLGIDWSALETLRSLQTGLGAALNSLGYNLTRKN